MSKKLPILPSAPQQLRMNSKKIDYPTTPKRPVSETVHGHTITDNYRWLEGQDTSVKSRALVRQWVRKQNECTRKTLNQKYRGAFSKELQQLLAIPFTSCPVPVKGRYFWEERRPEEDQFVLYWRQGLRGKPHILYNPNGKNKHNTVSIDFWNFSPNGTYVTYGLSQGGSEISALHIKEVVTGKELETIPYTWHSPVRWLPDESGFFYTRLPKPGTVPKHKERYHQRVRFHALGTDSTDDPIIFGDGRHKEDMFGLTISGDGRYLLIHAARNWTQNDVFLYNTQTKQTTAIVKNIPYTFGIQQTNGMIYCRTNYKANNYRMLRANLDSLPKAIDNWEEFIPESTYVLDAVSFTADRVLAKYLDNVCTRIDTYSYAGKKIGKLPIPALSSLTGMSTRASEHEFFFATSNFLTSKTMYRYNPKKDTYELFRKPYIALSSNEYVAKQVWYTSVGEQKVPMFIVHKKDIKLDGTNPTLLYGYGGFNTSLTPSLPTSYLPLLKRGLVYAIANIRGGGEFGTDWHKAAILQHKQRSFDDFITASEYLVNQKYTCTDKLAILGGSNGGLLVGACMTQRPDLYKAVVCAVPLLDMVRFPLYLIASRWVNEFGDPKIKNEFNWLKKWSPYHNVKPGIEYPNILLKTSENDGRVHTMHAWKMAALLQAHNTHNVVLLHTDTAAGHGPGKPKSKGIAGLSDTLSFLAWQLEIAV